MIRAVNSMTLLGETGRLVTAGGNGGPASLFSNGRDSVTLGDHPIACKTYAAPQLFKIMGAVELFSSVPNKPSSQDMDGGCKTAILV